MLPATHIQTVRAYEVIVPAKEGAINSPGWLTPRDRWDLMPIVLLEFEMEDGLVALGEVEHGHDLAELSPWLAQLPGLALQGWSMQPLPANWRGDTRWGLLAKHPPALWQSPSPVLRAPRSSPPRLGRPTLALPGG